MKRQDHSKIIDKIATDHAVGPVQLRVSRVLPASPDQVFSVLAEQQSMADWVPLLSHVEAEATCSTGESRVCTFGGQPLRETIVHWDPPRAYAYRAEDTDDAHDHLGVIECRTVSAGRVEVAWTQCFTPTRAAKGWLTRQLMKAVLSRALRNLERRVSGAKEAA